MKNYLLYTGKDTVEEIKVLTDDWMRVRLQTETLRDKSAVF